MADCALQNTAAGSRVADTLSSLPFRCHFAALVRARVAQAMIDIAHLLRPAHLASLSNILKDPEASSNDKFVALELLKNANIASAMVLPGCQDTGTAIVQGKKGQNVWTAPLDAEAPVLSDEEALSKGVYNAYVVRKNCHLAVERWFGSFECTRVASLRPHHSFLRCVCVRLL